MDDRELGRVVDLLQTSQDTIDGLRVEIKKLQRLLKPLANLDVEDYNSANKPDIHPVYQRNATFILLGDVRKAKRGLSKE